MYRAFINLPADFKDIDVAALPECIDALAQVAMREGTHTGPWKIEWIFEKEPDTADLTARLVLQSESHGFALPALDWTVETIDTDTDWLQMTYRAFPPFAVGPFFIYGSHYEEGVPEGLIPLQIDAATAFGSGEHGTTKGCIQAMLDLKGQGICPWNVLDVGTGSGILALAAWKLWKTPILATDIDEEAVRVAAVHADVNGVSIGGSALSLAAGDGFNIPDLQRKKPYELVIANILAGPLIEMAADLTAVLDKPGYVILSGMLVTQATEVLAAYEACGLKMRERYDIGEWATLVLQRP